ncbi:type III-B CRISPR module-associated protein Cmr5 [Desulfofundulus sp. TPOSR]|uniref:type III-B CRISPR module-associated protein Cmr5 n=1 Tax=Desulfofundulus sp. TPOSR TaxID=2714340 RepID=UPI00140B2DA6|nr:type III-B CRISPR module-associated protein Cmr5 [Desulfofundulus sp. TPOSR]NHM26267.1 type III-B CRISPR module-associated protein Cmr5 [Desulfofundulus sp. TPOSR]
MKRTLEQERAAHALSKVHQIEKTLDPDKADKFASYVERLPATILNNGLGQALATLLAQSKGDRGDPHYQLYAFLHDWLCRDDPQAPYRTAGDLMEAIVNNDRRTYLRAQAEALSWLNWLKKFAVAYLKKNGGGR